MKRALVTGSSGFIGRHMAVELINRGWQVELCDLTLGFGWADANELFRTQSYVYDLVVHCAYHVGGRMGIDKEPARFAKNLQLDASMFEWAVRTKQKRVLYFSSSAAYPVDLQQSYLEGPMAEYAIDLDEPGLPDGRYGWAKLTGEHMARAARLEGLPVTVVRPFSGYGESQSIAYPFGAFIDRAKRRADPFEIWGYGTQIRDWIHVSDVVNGALAVVESETEDPVNICTGNGTSMNRLAWDICQQVGYEPMCKTLPDRPTGVQYRVGCPELFNQFYKPKVSLEEGIRRALDA